MRRRHKEKLTKAIIISVFVIPALISFNTGWNYGVVLFMTILIIIFLWMFLKNKQKNPNNLEEVIFDKEDYKKSMIDVWFKPKDFFFTRSEIMFFNILEKENRGKYRILSKVRMEDVVEAKKGAPYGKRKHVSSRHLDFVLLNGNKVFCAIELDGSSHNSWKQKKSDKLKNEILDYCRIRLHRIRVGEDFEEEIKKILE